MSAFAAYHYGMFSRRKFLQIAAASSGLAITGTDLLNQAVANASSTVRADGSRGIRHIVILMMENRSFDHFLGWLPGADGRHDLTFVSAVDGNTYPNYPLAPDFQGCGYSDPDHSWEGWLVEHNYGKMDGFLQRPTTPPNNPGVTLAAANTFPIGYYTNFHHDGTRKALPDLPVIGALAEQLHDAGPLLLRVRRRDLPEPLLPARGADRPGPQLRGGVHRCRPSGISCPRSRTPTASRPAATTTVTPRSSPCGPSPAIEPGATFKYQAFFHPFSDADASTAALSAGTSFVAACQNGTLPNVCYIDPAFDNEGDRDVRGRPPAGRHPARRAVHRRRLPRPGRQRLPRRHGLHRDVRRVGRLLRPRAAAAGHRRHQPGERHARRRQHHPDRRPADPELQAARLPGPRHRGVQPGAAAPGRARGPVRALLQPRADRVHLRPERR